MPRIRGRARRERRAHIHPHVNLQDPVGAERSISVALKAHRYDGLLTRGGASIAAPTLNALQSDQLVGRLTYATLGIGPQVLRAVETGQIAFAADQQPYLRGYLPIVMLTEYRLYGVLPAQGEVVSTGAVFITKRDAGHVLSLVNRGVR
jgi:simple sugar transport system substrate-binding protein